MLLQQVRQFGRNISNVDHERKKHKKQTTKTQKKVLPRSTATFSVFTDAAKENQAPPGLALNVIPQPFERTGGIRKPLGVLYEAPAEEEMDDFEMEDVSIAIEYDIDQQDAHNPQFVSEYAPDIFSFLKEKELAVQIPPNYMSAFQTSLEPRHREILINWISEVYFQLKLLSETLFLTVDIVDRLLSCRTVTKRKLHLVGLGALMIASKFEETYAPPLSDLRICSENSYSEDEMLRVERVILNALDFNLCIPSPLIFLRRYSKAAQSDSTTHTLSKYICEISVTSYDMIEFLPSHIAVASIFLARKMRGITPEWDATMLHHAQVAPADVFPCAVKLNNLLFNITQKSCHAIYRKYSDARLLSVSQITPVPL